MWFRGVVTAAALALAMSPVVAQQSASQVIAAASRAMGADTLTSITLSGSARNGQFGQSKDIANPMGAMNISHITAYTRTIDFATPAAPTALVSRATGPMVPPIAPGGIPPTQTVFNQNITGQQAGNWAQALNVWTTPWGFLKSAAAASDATMRREGNQQVVSFSPAGFMSPSGRAYTVTGYINAQNQVTKVETRVEHAVVGDLLVAFEYSGYQAFNGVQVPTRIIQRQDGMPSFEGTITAAVPNPANLAELLTPPPAPPRAGGAGPGGPGAPGGRPGGPGGAPAAPPVERLADGLFKIGGGYTSLAIDMGDHIIVVELGQNDARGNAVVGAAKQAIPNKPIRFVVTSHAHVDHAGGVQAGVAEGATVLTHRNNEAMLERWMSGPRTLANDSLARVTTRRTNVVEGVGDRDVRRGSNGRVVELIRIPNEHSDGLLVVYLPAEKMLWSADIMIVNPNPAEVEVVRSTIDVVNRLELDFETWIPAHAPNPDRPLTRADVLAVVARAN